MGAVMNACRSNGRCTSGAILGALTYRRIITKTTFVGTGLSYCIAGSWSSVAEVVTSALHSRSTLPRLAPTPSTLCDCASLPIPLGAKFAISFASELSESLHNSFFDKSLCKTLPTFLCYISDWKLTENLLSRQLMLCKWNISFFSFRQFPHISCELFSIVHASVLKSWKLE